MNTTSFEQLIGHALQGAKHHAYLLVSRTFAEKTTPTELVDFLLRRLANIQLHDEAQGLDAQAFWDSFSRHPDLHRADSERSILRKDEIEIFRDRSLYPPTFATRRFFLLERVERLNNQSANALLKTLEEPQAACVFVLTTSQPAALPTTIASRCQKLLMPAWEKQNSALASLEPEDQKMIESIFLQKKTISPPSIAGGNSLYAQNSFQLDAKLLHELTVWADQAGKRYTGALLRDAFVEKTSAALLEKACDLSRANTVLTLISRWSDADSLNPSNALWLMRIVLTLTD